VDKNSILGIISCFRKALESRGVKIDRIILYGSWAKGTQREDSDIDLVVISEDFKEKDFWQRINLLSDAIYEVFAPIEARAFTPEEWERGDSFVVDYVKEKEVVFG
jgi:predicted nucleotidyltransferase